MKSRQIHRGRVVDLRVENVVLPNGRAVELEVVRHPGGAAVVAVDADDRICLLRQFRHAAGGWLWELPAGKLEPGEPPVVTAQRELAEEAGLTAQRIEPLGRTITTPGFSDEVIHLYLATGLLPCAEELHDDEVIEVHWFDRDRIAHMIKSGEIEDAKTLLGLLLAGLC
jgi:ADP-ribose pyrophosphatase